MRIVTLLINLFIYANIWIAACAALLCIQISALNGESEFLSPYNKFVFFSTIVLYALHRLVGILKMDLSLKKGRFEIIETIKRPILVSAIVAFGFSLYYFFLLEQRVQYLLLPAIILSLAYVLPLFKNASRLRDLAYIKIFLIALVWAYLCVAIPLMESGLLQEHYFLIIEKCLFIFGITIPFDIRDMDIDKVENVETIPGKFGAKKSKRYALILIVLAIICGFILQFQGLYQPIPFIGLIMSYIISIALINGSRKDRNDYYYAGWMDGLIAFQSILIIGTLILIPY